MGRHVCCLRDQNVQQRTLEKRVRQRGAWGGMGPLDNCLPHNSSQGPVHLHMPIAVRVLAQRGWQELQPALKIQGMHMENAVLKMQPQNGCQEQLKVAKGPKRACMPGNG